MTTEAVTEDVDAWRVQYYGRQADAHLRRLYQDADDLRNLAEWFVSLYEDRGNHEVAGEWSATIDAIETFAQNMGWKYDGTDVGV